ncbi:DUF6090 family protein [Aquiflexum sp.]|uniref:DUF6090 family protein n=1 Tax=Aquiflexum sp. TaxID=1872584 RepID=UPI0035943471
MIKFFRHIRQKLLSEDKFSRYLLYAIGEIVLVVIGILIALSINNWNEYRKETNFEQKILRELKSDFEYNESELNSNIIKSSTLASNCDSLLALFNLPKAEVDPINYFNYTRRLGGYSTFSPSNGALNALISSGNLYIIKNDSLRMHLARWSGMIEDAREDEMRLIAFGDTNMNPFRLEYLNLTPDSTYVDPALLENFKFKNIVRTIRERANYNVENYEILGVEITKILDEINRELNPEQK